LIATGSMPVVPPIPGVKEGVEKGYVLTNREILDLGQVPASLVIIGGGVIGLEMASYFNSAGSKVTIIEMLDHIAGNTDREISDILMKNYQKKGVEFKLGSKVVEVKGGAVVYEAGGQKLTVAADKILMSIGRRPVTEGLGLEKIGVELVRGAVKVDEKGKTNIPEVYAAGDVNGVSMLAHTAYREAEVCINNIIGKKDHMRYEAIPSVIYTNPEVGCVGETEESAKQKGIEYEVSKISMMFSGRYVAENEGGDGICKVLVDKKYKKLIGVHMIGNYASEIIFGAGLMIETEMVVDDIKELVFPHPTVCEIIREAIFQI
jgi:dihydrolipoamide dehydrogenase